jgi:hypothetical protein
MDEQDIFEMEAGIAEQAFLGKSKNLPDFNPQFSRL